MSARRGQGLPLNTIIVSIIVIVVLVVIILIFVGNLGPWNEDLSSCPAQGGSCVADASACSEGRVIQASCEDFTGDTCCVTI